MGTSHTKPETVAAHVTRIQKAADEFNAALEAAAVDHVHCKYAKGEPQRDAWNGPIRLKEITHVVWLKPAETTDQV